MLSVCISPQIAISFLVSFFPVMSWGLEWNCKGSWEVIHTIIQGGLIIILLGLKPIKSFTESEPALL